MVRGDDDGGVVVQAQLLELVQVFGHDAHVPGGGLLQGGVLVVLRLGGQVIGRMRALEELDQEVFAVVLHGAQPAVDQLVKEGVAVQAGFHLAAAERHGLVEIEGVGHQVLLERVRGVAVRRQLEHGAHQPVVAHGVIAARQLAQVRHVGLGVLDAEIIVVGIEEVELVALFLQRGVEFLRGFAFPGALEPGVDGHGVVERVARQHVHHRREGADVGRVAVVVIGEVPERPEQAGILPQRGVDIIVAVIVQQKDDHVALGGYLELLVAGEHIGGLAGLVRVAEQVLRADHPEGDNLHRQQQQAHGAHRAARALFQQQQDGRDRGQHAGPDQQVFAPVRGVARPIDLLAVQQAQVEVQQQVLHVAAYRQRQQQRDRHGEGLFAQQRYQARQRRRRHRRHPQQRERRLKIREAEIGGVAGKYLHAAPQAVHEAYQEAGRQGIAPSARVPRARFLSQPDLPPSRAIIKLLYLKTPVISRKIKSIRRT